MSMTMMQALEGALLLDKYPKSSIDISVLVLQDDGGSYLVHLPLSMQAKPIQGASWHAHISLIVVNCCKRNSGTSSEYRCGIDGVGRCSSRDARSRRCVCDCTSSNLMRHCWYRACGEPLVH